MAPVEELVLLDLDRSNKGASKQRRDQINAEINVLRDLLPLPESSRQRLSQLQVMSLSCVYIRKCNILQKLFRSQSQEPHLPDSLDFFQAMTGFLLVTTREGKLIYISENVTDYLGHSMVDMKTQGDSLYDIVDKRDHGTVQAKLLQGGTALDAKDIISEDVSFFCRMNMSRTLKRQSGFGDVKVMHIQGHFVATSNADGNNCLNDQQYVFMASCSPLITPDLKENLVLNNTKVFKTVHHMDMAFMEVTKMAEHHLGYTSDELFKTSWYSMIYPEDIHEAKEKHMQLVRSNHHEIGCMMTVRMLKADGSFFWVNIVMHVKQTLLSQSDEPYIVCINQIISAQEAYQIRVQGQMFSMYPGRVQELWGNHMPSIASTQNFGVNQWIQQEGNNSVPVPGFQCPMPNYPSQTRYQIMYPSASPSLADMDRSRKCSRGTTQYDLPNLVQTDKLKAMLKRKIQGPTIQSQCRPGKVPKMSWDVEERPERKLYQEIDPSSLVLPQSYRNGELHRSVDNQGQVVQVMMATAHTHNPGIYVSKKSVPDIMTNDFTTVSQPVKVEQVVPDINVPESYLTPDPSPISSPEPSYMVKTEVMDPDEIGSSGTSSACILQALEKLASQPQEGLSSKTSIAKQTCVKSEGKALPIFDAFEIDNFFDMLGLPDSDSKASIKMENSQMKRSNTHLTYKPQVVVTNELQMNSLKTERKLMSQPAIDESSAIPHFTPALLPVKTEVKDPEVTCYHSNNRKDIVVSSTMIESPKSVGSQDTLNRSESLDDLLSCFSEECLDASPLQHSDCSNSDVDVSICSFGTKDSFDTQSISSFDSAYQMPIYLGGQRAREELSPQSTSSCLSREDDMMDKSTFWNFGMELDVLDTTSHMKNHPHPGMKSQDSLGVDDVFGQQVDMLIDSLVPSQGSF